MSEEMASSEYLQKRWRDLVSREGALNSLEPAPDEKRLLKCLEDEERSRVRASEASPAPAAVIARSGD